jgi:hypothetical protein
MVGTKPTYEPEHEGKELERLEQDRLRQKALFPALIALIASIGKVLLLSAV